MGGGGICSNVFKRGGKTVFKLSSLRIKVGIFLHVLNVLAFQNFCNNSGKYVPISLDIPITKKITYESE